MQLENHVFHIRGLSPLVMHNPVSMLTKSDGKAKTAKSRIPTPEAEAEAGLYRAENGDLLAKNIGFKKGILYAATGKKIGRLSAFKVMAAAVFEIEEYSLLYDPETGDPIRKYEVYVTTVVVQKARILRARPRIHRWALSIELELNLDYVTPDQVAQLLGEAGLMAGLGDNRPQTGGGRHGRYEVLSAPAYELKAAAE